MPEQNTGRTIETLLAELDSAEPGPGAGEELAPEMGVEVADSTQAVEPPAELEAPPAHHSQEQPRDETGRFVPDEQPPQGEGAGEAQPQEEEPQGEETELAVVTLAGEDGEEIALEIEDPDVAARLNDLVARARDADDVAGDRARVRELEQEAEARMREMDEIQEHLALDPAGFLAGNVRPEYRRDVVLELLTTDDTLYEAVTEALDGWQVEPHQRQLRAAQLQAERVKRESDFQREIATRRTTMARATELIRGIKEMIPQGMPPQTASRFFEDAYRDLADHGRKNGWDGVSPETLPKLLDFRIRQYGIDGTADSNGASRPESGVRVARPANAKAEALTAKAQTAKKEADRMRLRYQRRRAAGASAPSGAGSPANRAQPPKGASLEDALDWASKNLGV